MNKKITIVLIIIIIIVGGYILSQGPKAQAPVNETAQTPETPVAPVVTQKIITFTDTGYTPNTLTIKSGEVVTWKNNSSLNMWPASAMHPSHIVYSGTSISEHCPDIAGTAFDACKGIAPGGSWSFTFNKKGSWGYHDHLNSNRFGKIIVE